MKEHRSSKMELDGIYENIAQKNATRNTFGPQTQSQNRRRSRRLMLITVLLGLMCVLLVIALIVLYIHLTAERDLMNMSYMKIVQKYSEDLKSLKMNYSHVTDERDQLQKNLQSINQIKLKFETEMKEINPKNGSGWYYISCDKKSWSDSRQFCRDRGGDLIIINTEEEQRYISSVVKERVWIGLSDIEKEGNMICVDNSTPNKTFWDKNEPNDDQGTEDCVELNPAKPALNNWNDLPCSEERKWICEN